MNITKEDVELEREVAIALEFAWDCEVKRMGHLSPFDWLFLKGGKVSAVGELKCRKVAFDTYSSIYFALRKHVDLLRAADGLGCQALFIVRYTDGIYFIKITDGPGWPCSLGGRTERGYANDIEPVFEIPTRMLKLVAEVKGENRSVG